MEEGLIPPKRKRGRPKLANPRPKTGKWEPVKWQPHYDTIVALSCIGYSSQTIADTLKKEYGIDYTVVHINNILNTKQASVIKDIIATKNREALVKTVESNLTDATIKASARVREFLESDTIFEKAPVAVMNASLKVLQGVGKIKSENNNGGGGGNVNIGRAIILSNEAASILRDGLNKADEVMQSRLLSPSPQD